jgi:streptogramin lyase
MIRKLTAATATVALVALGVAWIAPAAHAAIIVEHDLDSNAMPVAIVPGVQGDLWVSEPGDQGLAQVTWEPDFQISEIHVPGGATPHGVAVVADGMQQSLAWYTDPTHGKIGRGTSPPFSPPTVSAPTGITLGPDGDLWFTDPVSAQIGEFVSGSQYPPSITKYPDPGAYGNPVAIATGDDGHLWIGEEGSQQDGDTSIVELDPADGTTTPYDVPEGAGLTAMTLGPDQKIWFVTSSGIVGEISKGGSPLIVLRRPNHDLEGITSTPDRKLWVTDATVNSVLRISLAGAVSEFPVKTEDSQLGGIAFGPDGNIWATEASAGRLAQIPASVSSPITEFPVSDPTSNPYRVTLGPDGDVWFTELGNSSIGQIAPAGGMPVEHSLGDNTHRGRAIAASPQGDLWITEPQAHEVQRMNVNGGLGMLIEIRDGHPDDITAGSDGNMWFTYQEQPLRIGRITPSGEVTTFQLFHNGRAIAIAGGPDGNLWVLVDGKVYRVTTDGDVTGTFPVNQGHDITPGPDGNLWISAGINHHPGSVMRMTTDGIPTQFSVDGPVPDQISAGPDGNLWFTQPSTDSRVASEVGMITTGGVVAEFSGVAVGAALGGIVAGSDGNLWFAEAQRDLTSVSAIGRIGVTSPTGQFGLSDPPFAAPNAVTAGPDGNVWFTDPSGGVVGSITPQGQVTTFAVPTPTENPVAITAGPDGRIWFAERGESGSGDTDAFAIDPTTGVLSDPFPIPGGYGVTSLTAGRDGHLWLCTSLGVIGRLTTQGVYQSVDALPGHDLEGITRGPSGGGMWFTDATVGGSAVGKVTSSGIQAEYPTPTPNAGPAGIVNGPGGKLWFTERAAGEYGIATKKGSIEEHPLPTANAQPVGVAVGSDGNVWISEWAANVVAQITPKREVTELGAPGTDGSPTGIVSGPDQNIWVADPSQDAIDHLLIADRAVVGVTDDGYTRTDVSFAMGGSGFWSYSDAAEDTHSVTDSSGLGLYDSGPRDPGSVFQFQYFAAGVYPYTDEGSSDTGSISVPMISNKKHGHLGDSFTLRWATITAPEPLLYEVQVMTPGGSFSTWQTVPNPTDVYTPSGPPGVYSFRIRIVEPNKHGHWCKPFNIRIDP